MDFQIGHPGVCAFLQSLLPDLDVVIQMFDDQFLPVKTELKEMKNFLLGFEDFLSDGERSRQHGDKGAEKWMNELKDLLYDIDDLLDEIKMEKQPLQQEITGQPSSNQVGYKFSDIHFTTDKKNRLGRFMDILRKLTKEANHLRRMRDAVQHDASRLDCHDSICATEAVSTFWESLLRDLDVVIQMDDFIFDPIEMELKEMKKLLEGVLDGERKRQQGDKDAERWMDDLKDSMEDVAGLMDEVKIEKQQLQLAITGEPINNHVPYDHSAAFFTCKNIKYRLGQVLDILRKHTEQSNPLELGRENDKNQIIEMLLSDDGEESKRKRKFEVICLVGMGGLGKTTLAELVFQDERVKSSFAVMSWACVSDVVNVIKLTQDLIESASVQGYGATNMPSGLPALQHRLKNVINDKKFLLVLDDVWTTKELEQLKGPLHFGAQGSKILVTTRLSKVAEDLGTEEPYRLEPLEDAQCLKIFNDNAFGNEYGIDNDEDLMKIGKEIVRKCKGIPLVAKLIGSLLKGEDKRKWKSVEDNDLWNLAYKDEDLHPGLRLSYFYLPLFLKRCFEYFALFPPGYKFDQVELVRMWMAEGLIEVKEGTEPEEVGNQYYNDLKSRSLIQEDDKIHDMVHHLSSIVCGSSFFCGSTGFSSSKSSLQLRSVRHAFFDDKLELFVDSTKLRTLIYKGDLCKELFSCKWSRVLKMWASRDCFQYLSSSLGFDLKHLRYLQLAGKFLIRTLPDSICTLTNLQVLDLSECLDLKDLPQDVGKLSNLRVLGLNHTAINCLPDSVCWLSNLRVLDLSFCKNLKTLPNDLGNLHSLHKLMLKESSISSLPESIVNARKLGRLEVTDYVKKIWKEPENIGKFTEHNQLSIEEGDINESMEGMNKNRRPRNVDLAIKKAIRSGKGFFKFTGIETSRFVSCCTF